MEANSVAAAASPPAPPRAPLGELDMNEFPQPGATTIAAGVSNHHHHSCLWTIHSLKIPGSKDAIDLMKHKDYDLVLPPKLYPPSWDERKSIVKAITEAAMHQGKTSLTQLTADRKKGRIVLGCNKGRKYYENTFYLNAKKSNTTTTSTSAFSSADNLIADLNASSCMPQYKEGVRQDRIVNKNAAIRGGGNHHQQKTISTTSGNNNGKKLARRSSTKKPTICDNLCKFKFKLKLEEGEHWIVKAMSQAELYHNHLDLDKSELVTRRAHLTHDQEESCKRYLHFTNAGAATNILNQELDGLNLSQQSARYIYQKSHDAALGIDEDKHTNNNASSAGGTSTANRLVVLLDKLSMDGHLRYVALYHEVKETTLLAISKAVEKNWKNEVQKATTNAANTLLQMSQLDTHTTIESAGEEEEPFLKESLDLCISNSDSTNGDVGCYSLSAAEDQMSLGVILEPIRSRLTVGKKVLLAVAWCREDERRLFELYPEVLMFDVTFGTNNEGRPMGVTACPDGDMNIFTPVRAFLPSQCRWVFDWVFRTVFPSLLGREPLKRLQLLLSDGDEKIYNAFDSVKSELYPRARHGLCLYHLVTQKLQDLGRKKFLEPDNKENTDMIHTFKLWIFSWMQLGGVESEAEFNTSFVMLRSWLSDIRQKSDTSKSMKHNAAELEDWLIHKLLYHKERWLFPLRVSEGLMTLNQKTSSPVEGVNHTMKHKSSKTVTPNMTMCTSFETQETQVHTRMLKWKRKTMQAYQSTPLWVKNSPTANELTTIAESLLQQRFLQQPFYACLLVSDFEVKVARLPGTLPNYCADCKPSIGQICPACSNNSPIPRFIRCRTVTFIDVGNGFFSVGCSCPQQVNTGLPCTHIVKIMPRILPRHCHVRWHKSYAALFGRDGFENQTKDMKKRQKDRRILVTIEEHKEILESLKNQPASPDNSIFDIPECHFIQNHRTGTISHEYECNLQQQAFENEVNNTCEDDGSIVSASQELYGMGLLTQDTGNRPDKVFSTSHAIYQSGNPYSGDLCAHIATILLGQDLQQCNS